MTFNKDIELILLYLLSFSKFVFAITVLQPIRYRSRLRQLLCLGCNVFRHRD